MKKLLLVLMLLPIVLGAQTYFSKFKFSEADTLRGALRAERTCYDVTHYHLWTDIDIENKSISGKNVIDFDYLEVSKQIQIDLFYNMELDSILWENEQLSYTRKYNAIFVDIPQNMKPGTKQSLSVYYHGNPIVAKMPPWDGGFVWKEDSNGNPFIGVACEGIGASLWWPNKDHLSDEPDSMHISITTSSELMAVANGNLLDVSTDLGRSTYHWKVSYPINNYNVTVNIADYVHFGAPYVTGSDTLSLDYYVLRENLEKAKEHFKQVDNTLRAFEHYFGKYPFWNDGFALVETPYLGMEHQGAIAYGNNYKKGYYGMAPKGMPFDYIIVHETGHEYFGNSVSMSDIADMWIHESFTTYMEALFVEYTYGRDKVEEYLMGQRMIKNKHPIIGPKDVNFEQWEGSDHYYKGSWMLHTLRLALEDDDNWFRLLRAFYDEFKYEVCTSDEVIDFFVNDVGNNFETGLDTRAYLDQYLRHPKIPVLNYKLVQKGKTLIFSFIWNVDEPNFNMPIKVGTMDHVITVEPCVNEWKSLEFKKVQMEDFNIFYQGMLYNVEQLK